MKCLIIIGISLAVLTGCQTLQTTKQPMPFRLEPVAQSDAPKTNPIPQTAQKNDPPQSDEPISFILERWF